MTTPIKQSSQSIVNQAKETIFYLHENIDKFDSNSQNIIEALYKDITDFGKLPKFTLRRIIKLVNKDKNKNDLYLDDDNIQTISTKLLELKNLLGNNFMNYINVKDIEKQEKNFEIIITVENILKK